MKRRKIQQYTIDGMLVKEYDSISSAAEDTGRVASSIGETCRCHAKGVMRKSCGFIWKYSDDANPPVMYEMDKRESWTEEKLKDLLKGEAKDMPFSKFCKTYSGARKFIESHNLWHLIEDRRINEHYTLEQCKTESLRFGNQKEMIEAVPKMFSAIKQRVWDKICFSHMKRLGSAMRRGIYAYEFSDKTVYVGLTSDFDRRHSQHVEDKLSAVNIKIRECGEIPQMKRIYDYTDVDEASRLEGEVLQEYISKGWTPLNRLETGGIGGLKGISKPIKWTHDAVITDALKYCTKKQWERGSKGAVSAAKKNGWYEEATLHMPEREWKWNKEKCFNVAKECKSIHEYIKKYAGAYGYSRRHGFFDEIKELFNN